MIVTGLVLAGGAGSRFGGPKALARTDDGTPWIRRGASTLRAGGCDDVVVALGAAAEEARGLVPRGARVVVSDDWADGVAATLRAGLGACMTTAVLDQSARHADESTLDGENWRRRVPDAVVILPVDTPETPPSAVARVIAAARSAPASALVQATYGSRPGHPVLIGSAHIAALAAAVSGDRGARPYLVAHDAAEVDCADLWSGDDIDRR